MSEKCPRTPGRLLPVLAILAASFASPASADGEKSASIVRFHLEASHSREIERPIDMDDAGWGGDAGVAIGRRFALLFDAGLEVYPGTPPVNDFENGRRRIEGGDWTVKTFGIGARISVPAGPVDVFGEATGGPVWADGHSGRILDAATGTTLYADMKRTWSGMMGDLGLGVRTRRAGRVDGYVAIRRRSYGEVFEGTAHGVAVQFRLGVLTR